MPERFRLPWTIHEVNESWEVRTADGFPITWFHFRVRQPIGTSTDRMTKDQARRMAQSFCRWAQEDADRRAAGTKKGPETNSGPGHQEG